MSALGFGPPPLAIGDSSWDGAGNRGTVRVGAALGVFARGMLAEMDVALGEWFAVAPRALAAWSIERVRTINVPGLSFVMARIEQGWPSTGRCGVGTCH
ncbi:hypothetical protein [Frigoriglobus tundricola]|uniref:Uncharacterized protein n=1 Tax=Frigoriglobus tundricola TaxID=2774151 RepID=A0A6M5Z278_9BACT|nr:hypothetical protein [Frigoriglobus tundricola]QJW99623.1 hypothetical protein FTUN_7241 [Frigoriglobus tundricola]